MGSTTPIEFIPWKAPGYQGRAFGYRGVKLLPGVCWVYQDALVAGRLLPSQEHIGQACKLLLKALTNHAIEDLIDQVTGFDDLRKREAINRLIERYVRKDALPWVKMFDIEFYRHIYRLNRWPFDPDNTARPGIIGHWTNDIYDRLAPGVRPELHYRVKRNAKGRPTQKLTQLLTPEEGKPRLRELLEGVKALMKVSADWDDFTVSLISLSHASARRSSCRLMAACREYQSQTIGLFSSAFGSFTRASARCSAVMRGARLAPFPAQLGGCLVLAGRPRIPRHAGRSRSPSRGRRCRPRRRGSSGPSVPRHNRSCSY